MQTLHFSFLNKSRILSVGIIIILIFMLFGCDSQSPGLSTTSQTTEPTVLHKTYQESCTVCHSSGKLADIQEFHKTSTPTLDAQITNVTVTENEGKVNMQVAFNLNKGGIPFSGMAASSIRFTVAQLKTGINGNPDVWKSYINRSVVKEAGKPGSAPDGTSGIQATAETCTAKGGIFKDNGDGTYSYTLSLDFALIKSPISVTYDKNLTHRIAMQVSGNISNAVYDFRPSDGAKTGIPTRSIAVTTSCNECHQRLGLHGGDRVEIKYCTTCHNPGSIDPNSGNTVDLPVMVHKIHMGENLGSVKAGGEYAIWGYNDTKLDFSEVTYPQDIRNCTKCHNGANSNTTDGDNWKKKPSKEACGSCHDTVSFSIPVPTGMTLHSDGPREDNSRCASCHFPEHIAQTHEISGAKEAVLFKYNIIKINGTAPGEFPTVVFSIINPQNGNKPYNILTDPAFTAGGGVSRLYLIIGWNTSDFNNSGSGSAPGQPISINLLTSSTANADGTFVVQSKTAIPSNIKGSGVVAIEGHPAADPDGDGVYNVRVPVKNELLYFPITDSKTVTRRKIADIDKCNKCHNDLSLHGNNRTGKLEVCVVCHNPNATDIRSRPADSTITEDKKSEEAIDFKYMIHSIHSAHMREKGIVLYGFGGSENNFGDVTYPGIIQNCETCHISGTYLLPINSAALPTTIQTKQIGNPDDDVNMTPGASVCSSCHDSGASKVHMQQNGGLFDFVEYETVSTTGSTSSSSSTSQNTTGRRVEDQPPGHTTRTDCNSCH